MNDRQTLPANCCKVQGYSDDLITIGGAITAEYDATGRDNGDPVMLAFSDGTLLQIHYAVEGMWHIDVVYRGPASRVTVEPGTIADEQSSDVAMIHAPTLKWVAFATTYED